MKPRTIVQTGVCNGLSAAFMMLGLVKNGPDGTLHVIDLPAGRTSGLVEAMKVVGEIEGISFVYFDDRDVVRHKLVQQIVKAYEAFSNGNGRPSTSSGRGAPT